MILEALKIGYLKSKCRRALLSSSSSKSPSSLGQRNKYGFITPPTNSSHSAWDAVRNQPRPVSSVTPLLAGTGEEFRVTFQVKFLGSGEVKHCTDYGGCQAVMDSAHLCLSKKVKSCCWRNSLARDFTMTFTAQNMCIRSNQDCVHSSGREFQCGLDNVYIVHPHPTKSRVFSVVIKNRTAAVSGRLQCLCYTTRDGSTGSDVLIGFREACSHWVVANTRPRRGNSSTSSVPGTILTDSSTSQNEFEETIPSAQGSSTSTRRVSFLLHQSSSDTFKEVSREKMSKDDLIQFAKSTSSSSSWRVLTDPEDTSVADDDGGVDRGKGKGCEKSVVDSRSLGDSYHSLPRLVPKGYPPPAPPSLSPPSLHTLSPPILSQPSLHTASQPSLHTLSPPSLHTLSPPSLNMPSLFSLDMPSLPSLRAPSPSPLHTLSQPSLHTQSPGSSLHTSSSPTLSHTPSPPSPLHSTPELVLSDCHSSTQQLCSKSSNKSITSSSCATEFVPNTQSTAIFATPETLSEEKLMSYQCLSDFVSDSEEILFRNIGRSFSEPSLVYSCSNDEGSTHRELHQWGSEDEDVVPMSSFQWYSEESIGELSKMGSNGESETSQTCLSGESDDVTVSSSASEETIELNVVEIVNEESPVISEDEVVSEEVPELSEDENEESPVISEDDNEESSEISEDEIEESPIISEDENEEIPEISEDEIVSEETPAVNVIEDEVVNEEIPANEVKIMSNEIPANYISEEPEENVSEITSISEDQIVSEEIPAININEDQIMSEETPAINISEDHGCEQDNPSNAPLGIDTKMHNAIFNYIYPMCIHILKEGQAASSLACTCVPQTGSQQCAIACPSCQSTSSMQSLLTSNSNSSSSDQDVVMSRSLSVALSTHSLDGRGPRGHGISIAMLSTTLHMLRRQATMLADFYKSVIDGLKSNIMWELDDEQV